ncbi:response regulator [Nostoc sp. NIES-2111]
MRVLLVEDEPLIAMVAEEMLLEVGHSVSLARTGREAIDVFRQPPQPELIMVDNVLPDMLGWEVIRVCREVDPNVPALMTSGDPERGAQAIDHVAFLTKPYTEADLLAAIADAIQPGKTNAPGL